MGHGFRLASLLRRTQSTAGNAINRATVRGNHDIQLDEPAWSNRGGDYAPCPVDYLLVGVAGCQLKSLRHCLERSRVDDYHISVSVEGEYEIPVDKSSGILEPKSNALKDIYITLEVTTTAEHEGRVNRCLGIADEQGCIVSHTVEDGVEVPLTTSVTISSNDNEKVSCRFSIVVGSGRRR